MKSNRRQQEIKKVLIVDDEPDLRDTLSRVFRAENISIETAENGIQALAALKSENFQAVLCDIMMPEMNGLDCLAQAQVESIPTPFVFLTGYADADRMLEAIRLGAVDFINKPFENREIVEVMFRVLEIGARKLEILRMIENQEPGLVNHIRKQEKMLSFMRLNNNLRRRTG